MVEIRKKVDESWKDQVAQEKQQPGAVPAASTPLIKPSEPAASAPSPAPEPQAQAEGDSEFPEARFDIFVSGLAMEALIGLGDIPHPQTNKKMTNVPHARYLIDILGLLEEKTRGNVSADEAKLLKDALYQLRMRYLAKTGGAK